MVRQIVAFCILVCHTDLTWRQVWREYLNYPTLLVGTYWAGLNPAAGMELCCLLGVVIGFAVATFDTFRTAPVMLMLWLLYLSVYKVGQVFLWFQWLVKPYNLSISRDIIYRFQE